MVAETNIAEEFLGLENYAANFVQVDGKTQVDKDDFRSYRSEDIDYKLGLPYKERLKAGTEELRIASRAVDIRSTSYKVTKSLPFYTQERIGKDGRLFKLIKLRIMVVDGDNVEKYLNEDQLLQWKRERKVGNDPRITKMGAFCRKCSLDELGKFLNVLVGDLPLRIIKMHPDFPVKMRGAFALHANEERTGIAAFPQFKSLCSAGLRNLQADFEYFIAMSAQTRQFFAKPIFEGDFAAKAVA